jgi:hypothetical protein
MQEVRAIGEPEIAEEGGKGDSDRILEAMGDPGIRAPVRPCHSGSAQLWIS